MLTVYFSTARSILLISCDGYNTAHLMGKILMVKTNWVHQVGAPARVLHLSPECFSAAGGAILQLNTSGLNVLKRVDLFSCFCYALQHNTAVSTPPYAALAIATQSSMHTCTVLDLQHESQSQQMSNSSRRVSSDCTVACLILNV